MNNASYIFREPKNEPVYSYAPGTPERAALKAELEKQYNQCIEIPLIIGGKDVKTGDMGTVVMPTEHKHVLAKYHKVGKKEVQECRVYPLCPPLRTGCREDCSRGTVLRVPRRLCGGRRC